MQPGVYHDLTNAEYHGGPGISKSGLDLIHKSPLHLRHVLDAANDEQEEPSGAFLIGTATHCAILEPGKFVSDFARAPRLADYPDAVADRDELVRRVQALNENRLPKLPTSGSKPEMIARIVAALEEMPAVEYITMAEMEGMKAAELKTILENLNQNRPGLLPTTGTMAELAALLREQGQPVTLWSDIRDEWHRNNGHRTILKDEEFQQVAAMRDAVMAHPMAARLLNPESGLPEQSVYWVDAITGELCRCRPDWWHQDARGDILVDLKTTEDASPEGFARSVAKWRYHVQAAMYSDGVEAATGRKPRAFVFIAVEKKAPHAVGVYALDAASIDAGRVEYRADLSRYAECRATGVWPGYSDKIQPISLPVWFMRQHEAANAEQA